MSWRPKGVPAPRNPDQEGDVALPPWTTHRQMGRQPPRPPTMSWRPTLRRLDTRQRDARPHRNRCPTVIPRPARPDKRRRYAPRHHSSMETTMPKSKPALCTHCGNGGIRKTCLQCKGAGGHRDPIIGWQNCFACGCMGYKIETCHVCNGSGLATPR